MIGTSKKVFKYEVERARSLHHPFTPNRLWFQLQSKGQVFPQRFWGTKYSETHWLKTNTLFSLSIFELNGNYLVKASLDSSLQVETWTVSVAFHLSWTSRVTRATSLMSIARMQMRKPQTQHMELLCLYYICSRMPYQPKEVKRPALCQPSQGTLCLYKVVQVESKTEMHRQREMRNLG